ncbi:MAG: DUF5060 domain-containing protein [Bacteroidota bacterium]
MKKLNLTEPRGLLVALFFNLLATTTLAQTVTGFTLVNADDGTDLLTLVKDSTLSLPDLPPNISLRAQVNGPVESVQFFVNGAFERTENVAPYTLAGDKEGVYQSWDPAPGAYELQAIPSTGNGGSGNQGEALTINIVFSEAEVVVTDITFTNCPDQLLVVGDSLDLDVAISPVNATNASVEFTASSDFIVDPLTGLFNATAAGQVTISATSLSDSTVSDQCVMGVIDTPAQPIDPYATVQATAFDFQRGVEITAPTVSIDEGDYLRFEIVEFGQGPASGTLRATSDGGSSTVEFRIGAIEGPVIASALITADVTETVQEYPMDIVVDYSQSTSTLGTQTVFLVVRGSSLLGLESFSFEPAEVLVTDVSFTNCPDQPLKVGDAVDLDVLIAPGNAADGSVTFAASDGASVDPLTGELTAIAPGEVTVTATSVSNTNATATCVISIEDPAATPAIRDFLLVDAVSNSDLRVLSNGDTLNLFYLPQEISVRVTTNPEQVGSVGFNYNGDPNFQTENFAPYAIAGDTQGDFKPWSVELGNNTLTATAYTSSGRGGEAGAASTVQFAVIREDTSTVADPPVDGPPATVSGELKKWHKVTLSFQGPSTSETAQNNPFANYRLNVTFTNGDKTHVVPGFYAADGTAANSSATSGNLWQVHFAPDEVGTWSFQASFRTGTNVAISTDPSAGTSTAFDGQSGSFDITPSDKTGVDFRGKGRLQYVGEHHLQFAETGDFFFKVGPDAPENTFAYNDFDATPNKANRRKSWAPHLQDFDLTDAGPYTWGAATPDGARAKGRALLGVIAYLSNQSMNAISFLTFSLDGDDDNVYPHLPKSSNATSWNGVHHDRFDVSKMAQWEQIMAYADQKGIYLHFKMQETENDRKMDGGQLGRERKLYYRELIARFGHHLALNWNLGEENDIWTRLNDPDNTIVKSYATYIKQIDPYDHNIVIHTFPPQKEQVYAPLLGPSSDLTGASLQEGENVSHDVVLEWVTRSAAAGKKWVVAYDEQNTANTGVAVDADYPDSQLTEPRLVADNRESVRQKVLWGTLMAGGAGVEYFYGYQTGCDDLDCQDHRTRQNKWDDAKITIDFFNSYLAKRAAAMINLDDLTPDDDDYVFGEEGELYLVYLPEGGTSSIDLSGQVGSYSVQWYDPRSGGALQSGTVTAISGGSATAIGVPPSELDQDWLAVIEKVADQPVAGRQLPVTTPQGDLEVYPNPTMDRLVISRIKGTPMEISIRALDGKQMRHMTVTDRRIELDLRRYDQGIYLIHLRQGDQVSVFRVVKQ